MIPNEILTAYSIDGNDCNAVLLSSGLINATWKVSYRDRSYIVQRINTEVFKRPDYIETNLEQLSSFLANFPDYLFAAPITNREGQTLTRGSDQKYYRAFPYIKNSYTIDKVSHAEQAFEAAAQFGKFTSMLRDFDVDKLEITIPDFHNITFRYEQFKNAISRGNQQRLRNSKTLIDRLKDYSGVVDEYDSITQNANFIKRVTHHDTKISNVLFDDHGKGLCVIDLDTVMPGYFISDVGDMMRTYLSPSTEEDTDFSKIEIREDVYQAIVSGYCSHTRGMLTEAERASFAYAGKFAIYMQALRFITDFLNDDVYYGAKYLDHNLNRGRNQLVLLEKFIQRIG